jgi:peptidoglycan L-alanyl-D-glutamate endopeptidase CwlK
MPSFGNVSKDRLATCHPDIQKVLEIAIKNGPDFTVVCGHRNEEDQNKAVAEGKSQTPWPTSNHNADPSVAVDIAPYFEGGILWNDKEKFRCLISYVLGIGDALGIRLRSGADWDRDWSNDDHSFIDWPHLEIIK